MKSIDLVLLYEKLVLAIRRDLGHRNGGLVQGEVLALFVNDVQDVIKAPSKSYR